MLKNIFKNYIYPIAALSGSIIGVGFLSLPYITLKVGAGAMLFYFVVLTALVACIHIIFSKVTLKTPDFKRWPGFVGYYLGPIPRKIILVTTTLGIFGVMVVYLIVGGQLLSVILNHVFGQNAIVYVLIYVATASVFVYLGSRAVARIDFLALVLLAVILLLVFFKGFSYINLQNINLFPKAGLSSVWQNPLLPYGVLLFSLWGAGFIPEIEEMVQGNKKSLKTIIIISTLVTAVFYALFTYLILSITGGATTESALIGLKGFLGGGIIINIALFMGVITTFMAFIAEGFLLKKMFMYDLGLKHFSAFILVCGVPLILFLLGFNSFIPLISFIGGVLISIDGILILLMYKKIGGKWWVIDPLMGVFLLGIIYEMIYFIR